MMAPLKSYRVKSIFDTTVALWRTDWNTANSLFTAYWRSTGRIPCTMRVAKLSTKPPEDDKLKHAQQCVMCLDIHCLKPPFCTIPHGLSKENLGQDLPHWQMLGYLFEIKLRIDWCRAKHKVKNKFRPKLLFLINNNPERDHRASNFPWGYLAKLWFHSDIFFEILFAKRLFHLLGSIWN